MVLGIVIVELGLMNLFYYFDWKLFDGMKVGDIDMEEVGIFSIVKK